MQNLKLMVLLTSIVSFNDKMIFSQIPLKKNVENKSGREIKVLWKNNDIPLVLQSYLYDENLMMEFFIKPDSLNSDFFQFPDDFMLEVPHFFLNPSKLKRLNQISIVGSHNDFANKQEGFLYYQQILSSKEQLARGVRMLRPAWHNPSGSYIDKPNEQPILCHAGNDSECATVSLATRNFKKHRLVSEENQLILDFLIKNREDFLIVGLNNYLSSDNTDFEIERISGLKDLIITQDDLQNVTYNKEWNGNWPTIEWMIKHNKRVLFFNDKGKTKYTIDYKKYVKMNQYATATIEDAAKFREGSPTIFNNPLVEISWFQDISLSHSDQEAIKQSVEYYESLKNYVMQNWLVRHTLEMVKFPFYYFNKAINLKSVNFVISFMIGVKDLILKWTYLSKITNNISNYKSKLSETTKKILNYIPIKQNKSLTELFNLINACKGAGIILDGETINILLLDFSVTEGQSIEFVNLLNFFNDEQIKKDLVGLGGFCYQGIEIEKSFYKNLI